MKWAILVVTCMTVILRVRVCIASSRKDFREGEVGRREVGERERRCVNLVYTCACICTKARGEKRRDEGIYDPSRNDRPSEHPTPFWQVVVGRKRNKRAGAQPPPERATNNKQNKKENQAK